MQTDAATPNMVGQEFWELLRPWCAMLGFAVHREKDTTRKTLENMCNASAWPQQCWKSGSNAVALSVDDHETKEMLGVVGSNV